ncbi:MAG TPA: hypothetical protein VFW50_13955 [Streptosporangiaceae bacterium]|nr:hypothetical protein [Streptosporangiaceae bacterium]
MSDSGDLAEIVAATQLIAGSVTTAALDPAASAGLISIEDTVVRFEHPLVRSAIYQRLSPTARRAGHDALARVLGHNTDRAVWHGAAAALHADPALAATLEQSADRALQRGATLTAVHALERSAQLSAQARDRRRRTFRAAALAYAAGRGTQADRLRSRYRDLIDDDGDRLRYEWLCELCPAPTGAGSSASACSSNWRIRRTPSMTTTWPCSSCARPRCGAGTSVPAGR